MANKKSNKKKAADAAASQAAPATTTKKQAKKAEAASAKKDASTKKAKAKNAKPGFFARVKAYFASVRSEMKRVVWPTKKELLNYSLAVCASLVVVGVAIALLDVVIGEGLVLFAGLRG